MNWNQGVPREENYQARRPLFAHAVDCAVLRIRAAFAANVGERAVAFRAGAGVVTVADHTGKQKLPFAVGAMVACVVGLFAGPAINRRFAGPHAVSRSRCFTVSQIGVDPCLCSNEEGVSGEGAFILEALMPAVQDLLEVSGIRDVHESLVGCFQLTNPFGLQLRG